MDVVWDDTRPAEYPDLIKGLLTFFPEKQDELKKQDPLRYQLVREIVEEENTDRRTIMQRILDQNRGLEGRQGLRRVGEILAEQNRINARPNWLVQMPDGRWVERRLLDTAAAPSGAPPADGA